MHCLIRADSSAQIGAGHVMRCLTLARALRSQGHQVRFACRALPGHLIPTIEAAGFSVLRLPVVSEHAELPGYLGWLGTSQEDDAEACLQQLDKKVDWLIVDHYALDTCWEQRMRERCNAILAIDDLANRYHDADVLLDQNALPDAEKRYRHHVSDTCIPLIGPDYALLRDEFMTPPPDFAARQGVLVSFGGADTLDLTGLCTRLLARVYPSLPVDIVVTANHVHLTQLRAECARHRQMTLHVQCDYMARLMHTNMLMIGAGGAMHWERCVAGIPALVITLAENQRPTTRYLADCGICVWLGDAPDLTDAVLTSALHHWLENPQALAHMSARGQALIPRADGAYRVAQHLAQFTQPKA